MAVDIKELYEQMRFGLEDMRKVLESKSHTQAEVKERVEKIDVVMSAYEAKNQEFTAALADSKKSQEELKSKILDLEKQLVRIPNNGKSVEDATTLEMKKALDIFMRKDDRNKTKEEFELERKYLRTDNDPSGGYLTPPEYYQEILKKIIEISPVRQYARVLRTSRESLLIPVRENILMGNWLGEGVQFQVSNSNYGLRELKVNMLSVSSVTTIQMIQDSVFNIEDQISMDVSESFAQAEGLAFVTGDGINKPEGILATAGLTNGIQVVNSGIATSFDGDSLINIAGQLKTGYDPRYMLNRRTLAVVRQLKDGLGQYLWTPGIANAYPSTINGYEYINAIDVPDVGAGNIPVLFGDFFRGYTIADHINMFVIRDNYTQSAQGKVVFNVIRRVGGMVTLAEAIKALKCSA